MAVMAVMASGSAIQQTCRELSSLGGGDLSLAHTGNLKPGSIKSDGRDKAFEIISHEHEQIGGN